jgi:hypothetical protein
METTFVENRWFTGSMSGTKQDDATHFQKAFADHNSNIPIEHEDNCFDIESIALVSSFLK